MAGALMDVDWMKRVDRRLGPWLLLASRAYRGADMLVRGERRTFDAAAGPVQRVLAVKLWGIGSLVQALPSFRALQSRFPEAQIDLLTIRGNQRLFDGQDLFGRVWTLDVSSSRTFLPECYRLWREIRRQRYDVLLNFEGFASFSQIFASASGANCTVGYATRKIRHATLETPFRPSTHIAEVYADLARLVGAMPTSLAPRLAIPADGQRFQATWRSAYGVGADEPVIGLNVNAGPISLARRWPAERFAELGRRLATELGARIVLVGSRDEAAEVAPVAQAIGPAAIDLSGKTTLGELLGLFADLDLLVTNDSGPLHLAVAVDTPTVSFFGPETPVIYGPRGPRHAVLYLGLPCSPCLTFSNLKRTDCDHFSCLRQIEVAQAQAAVVEHWRRFRRGVGERHLMETSGS